MSDISPSIPFKVPASVASPLRRYTERKTVFTLLTTLAWTAVVIPVFVMDVFALTPNIFIGAVLLLALFPLVIFGAPVALLNKPTQELARIITRVSRGRFSSQDVALALKKAPWGYLGMDVAGSTGPTIRDGILFSSKGHEWLIEFSRDLSTGTVSNVSLDDEVADNSSRPHEHVIMLPKSIASRRNAASLKLLIPMGIIFIVGCTLSFNQNYVTPTLGIVLTTAIAAGSVHLFKSYFMANSYREISRFITRSLGQSAAFEKALLLTFRNGTFRRIRNTAFSHSIETLEVSIEPVGEPSWTILEQMDGKGYTLTRNL